MRQKFLLFIIIAFVPALLSAQKQKADSLQALLAAEKTDTGRVQLLCKLVSATSLYDPLAALGYAQNALSLSNEIKYTAGQSLALGSLANTFRKMGNYSRSLEYNFKKLELEEKQNDPRNLTFVLMNIGIVYRFQEEYQQALTYYYKTDSVINKYELADMKYHILLNLGDVYDRLNKTDSSFSYFNKALILSNSLQNDDYIGNSMTGLGHTYLKMGNTDFALLNYRTAIEHLQIANDDEVLCEAWLGLAKLFRDKTTHVDSAAHYARMSLSMAAKDGFLNWQLDASRFLSEIYKGRNTDSAFFYLSSVQQLNDSVNSKEKIRQIQLLSSNENLRQLEIAESKRIAQKERKQQLQYLFIGIFIPGFFLLTLLLSRIKIHTRIIKILGVLSLLILFEYLLLLLHPTVAELTNHTPVYEMFIFVAIAALLIPGHHRFESWLIEKLTHRTGSIKMKKVKFKVKGPSN